MLPSEGSDFPAEPRRLTQTLSFLAKRGINALFKMKVDADPKNSTVNSLQLYQSGLTLPSKVYYTQDDALRALYETIADTLNAVFSKSNDFDWNESSANITACLIVDFEKKLADLSQLIEYFQDPRVIYNPMSLTELNKIAPAVDWNLYVDDLALPTSPYPDRIVVTSPNFIGNVSSVLLGKETTGTLQAYFIWKVIYAYSDVLGEDVRTPIHRLTAKLRGSNPKSIKPRWETCIEEVNGALGFLAGRYYIIESFGGDVKKKADEFVNSIKDAFVKRLPELTWIDDATREKAVEKIDKLIHKVGYPDNSPDVMSPVSLADYYGELNIYA